MQVLWGSQGLHCVVYDFSCIKLKKNGVKRSVRCDSSFAKLHSKLPLDHIFSSILGCKHQSLHFILLLTRIESLLTRQRIVKVQVLW